MNCDRTRPELGAYLDGELEPEKRAAVEAHVKTCPSCREELGRLRRVSGLVKSLGRERAPEGLLGKVMAGIAEEEPAPREGGMRRILFLRRGLPLAGLSAAAAAILVAMIVFKSENGAVPGERTVPATPVYEAEGEEYEGVRQVRKAAAPRAAVQAPEAARPDDALVTEAGEAKLARKPREFRAEPAPSARGRRGPRAEPARAPLEMARAKGATLDRARRLAPPAAPPAPETPAAGILEKEVAARPERPALAGRARDEAASDGRLDESRAAGLRRAGAVKKEKEEEAAAPSTPAVLYEARKLAEMPTKTPETRLKRRLQPELREEEAPAALELVFHVADPKRAAEEVKALASRAVTLEEKAVSYRDARRRESGEVALEERPRAGKDFEGVAEEPPLTGKKGKETAGAAEVCVVFEMPASRAMKLVEELRARLGLPHFIMRRTKSRRGPEGVIRVRVRLVRAPAPEG